MSWKYVAEILVKADHNYTAVKKYVLNTENFFNYRFDAGKKNLLGVGGMGRYITQQSQQPN